MAANFEFGKRILKTLKGIILPSLPVAILCYMHPFLTSA